MGSTALHNVDKSIIRVFKPHGSADFDLCGITSGKLSYPLCVWSKMNNFPLKILSSENYLDTPSEPVIVLPYESNPYSNYQWVAPGYRIFGNIAPNLTHLVFIGLSYHQADRREIDHFLFSTSKDCLIIVADPFPPKDFVNIIKKSGLELQVWKNGPQDLPLR